MHVGLIGDGVFVADDGPEARDGFGGERGRLRLDDIHNYSLSAFLGLAFELHGGAAQPVIDGFAELRGSAPASPRCRSRPSHSSGVERAKIAEKIGGGFPEIALFGQIQDSGGGLDARQRGRSESQ